MCYEEWNWIQECTSVKKEKRFEKEECKCIVRARVWKIGSDWRVCTSQGGVKGGNGE